jgi:hypothetical protein
MLSVFPNHMNRRGADDILAMGERLIEEAGSGGFVLIGNLWRTGGPKLYRTGAIRQKSDVIGGEDDTQRACSACYSP